MFCTRGTAPARRLRLQAAHVHVLSHIVTHLKLVAGDEHAVRHFDHEIKAKLADYAKAAGIEAVISGK